MKKHNFDITQFVKEANGQYSGMRLAVLITVLTACNMGVTITAAVASGLTKDPVSVGTVCGLITTMISGALGFKAMQKGKEEPAPPQQEASDGKNS